MPLLDHFSGTHQELLELARLPVLPMLESRILDAWADSEAVNENTQTKAQASSLIAIGRFTDALKVADAGIERFPEDAGHWINRATALAHLGPGSSIINMGSMLSLVGWEREVPYSATKGAVMQFTKSLALEVGAKQIRVNCVCPGIIDTPMTRSFLTDPSTAAVLEAEYGAASPFGRMGTADEIARGVLFLASDDSTFVTGTTLVIDGGATAR